MKIKLFAFLMLTLFWTLSTPLSTAIAQGTAFTYQGRVTDNGTNFTGAGQFKFALVTSTNANHTATATATAPSGGFITGYVVTSGGNGYVTAPAVMVLGGGGSGAAATANISGGAVTSISVNNPGNGGYTTAPMVTVAPPPPNVSYATYWSNGGTSVAGSEPSAAVSISVNNGLFTVVLGDTTQPNMTAIDASLFAQANLQLRIWFSDGVNGFAALSPVQNLTPTPYAIAASNASNLLGTLPVAQLSGTLTLTQLPGALVTNNETSLNLNGTFSGNYSGNGGGLTNLGGTFVWQTVSGTTQQAQPNTGYIITNNSPVTLALPTAPNIGDVVRVSGIGFGGWKVAQNIGQSILIGVLSGNIAGTNWTPRDSSRGWVSVASSSDGNRLVAVVVGGQIYASTDAGATWSPHGITTNWQAVASSADGTKLAAAVNNGQIYTSTDSGTNWTAQTGSGSRNWWSIASSADGTKLVAVVDIGQIYTSPDSGLTWTARDSTQFWDSVASSADGTKLVAMVFGGQIRTSTDSGVTWTVQNTGTPNWQAVASSADGTKLVAVVNDGQIYTSTDSGTNWLSQSNAPSAHWYSIASSADGTKLIAVVNDSMGGDPLYTSTDSGATWALRLHAGTSGWRSVASSADGTKLVAVIAGDQIFTSTSDTTYGTAGYLLGSQNAAIELQYLGNGQFLPISHEGIIQAF